jgi:hypothetical protein
MQTNDSVNTPNGPGTVIGETKEHDAVMVAHTIAKMTGKEFGICFTPRAKLHGVWQYKIIDVVVTHVYAGGEGKQSGALRKRKTIISS